KIASVVHPREWMPCPSCPLCSGAPKTRHFTSYKQATDHALPTKNTVFVAAAFRGRYAGEGPIRPPPPAAPGWRNPVLDQLLSSRVLTIHRSPDFDHFRSIESLGDHRSIPLHWRDFAASFAAVTLKSCSIYLQRSFPRILQARYISTGAIIGFGIDDTVSAIIDGVEAPPSSVLLVKGQATCEIVEPHANLSALIKFDAIEDRGWPSEVAGARLIAAQPAALAALRSVTRDILLLASNSADLLAQPQVIDQLEESLLRATDHVLQTPSLPGVAGRVDLNDYLHLVRGLDEFLQHNAGKVVYSADLARTFGVPVRTLNNAVVAIRGMSMHRYIRLRRLWSVRQQLVQGATAGSLKAIALAHGFWHMGEFRALYRELFGETPQQTLEAPRRGQSLPADRWQSQPYGTLR
ncbi:helix-turn-helix domain-containing protein, partial [Bradyrhizobium sp.]|uniref:helix-turn-helix domain-containing protein n=1 Tax=Bradyrhizobium sp. TaxID=376 RepID=UPI004037B1D3